MNFNLKDEAQTPISAKLPLCRNACVDLAVFAAHLKPCPLKLSAIAAFSWFTLISKEEHPPTLVTLYTTFTGFQLTLFLTVRMTSCSDLTGPYRHNTVIYLRH
jgi:hypothetical protein